MDDFLKGIYYFLSGWKLIFQPGLRRFILIPLLINILFFIGFFFLISFYFSEFNGWFTHYLPTWLQWASIVLWILFFIAFLLVFIYSFVTVTNLIAAPFNSVLSEKVEFYLTGVRLEQRNLYENIKDIPRTILRQLAILGYYFPYALFFLILFLIPLIQVIAPLLWFLFNAHIAVLIYMDFPTDLHRISLKETRIFLKQNRIMSLGFGTSVLIATMIPVLNLFVIPAAVAGATKFWVREYKIR